MEIPYTAGHGGVEQEKSQEVNRVAFIVAADINLDIILAVAVKFWLEVGGVRHNIYFQT